MCIANGWIPTTRAGSFGLKILEVEPEGVGFERGRDFNGYNTIESTF